MEIEFIGANCFVLTLNKQAFIVDPPSSDIVKKLPKFKDPIVLKTNLDMTSDVEKATFTVDSAGEYEIEGVAIRGVQTASHTDVHDSDVGSNVAYTLRTSGQKICVLGHSAAKLTEQVHEEIGAIDILILPVGGGGLTLDAKAATKMVKEMDPQFVIPSHYAHKGVEYPSPQDEIGKFLDEIGGTIVKEATFKPKQAEDEENLYVYVLKPTLS